MGNLPSTSFPLRKIKPPALRSGHIRRERLLDTFRDIEDEDLILVSAPAGYGKTSLLANWAEVCSYPLAWVSLDKGDNDEIQFWRLLIEALQSAVAAASGEATEFGGPTMQILEANRTGTFDFQRTEQLLSGLISELERLEFERFWLVFDDYHLIQNGSIHHGLSYFLKYRPKYFHTAMAARSDPQIQLGRLRAADRIVEIRHEALLLSPEEIDSYLAGFPDLRLSEKDIAGLVERTEGWISALRLAASALQSRQDQAGFISGLAGAFETIAAFLAAEVYNNQPEEIQKFLINTSILDRLIGPLCDAVTGRSDSQKLLEELLWTNVPIETVDSHQGVYRYLQLFSDMLKQRLQKEDPDKYVALHKQASTWFESQAKIIEDHELTVLAIEHAITSQDFQRAANLLEQNAIHLLGIGLEAMLIEWIDDLPMELILPSPVLVAYRLYSILATGNIYEAERHIQEAEKIIGVTDSGGGTFLGRGMLRAMEAQLSAHGNDLDKSIELTREAIRLLPASEPFWMTICMVGLAGSHMMKGDFAQSELLFEEALNYSQKQNLPYLVEVTDMKYLICLYYRGHMARIKSIYEKSKSKNFSTRLSDRLFGGILDSQYGQVLCESGLLDQALTHAEIGLEKSERFNNYYVLPLSWLAMIQIQHSRGDWEGLEEAIANLDRISYKVILQPWINNQLKAWKIRAMIYQNKIAKAWAIYGQSDDLKKLALNFVAEELFLAHARLLLAEERFDEAETFLDRLGADASQGGRTRKVVEIYGLKAITASGKGDTAGALESIEQALNTAEPFDFLQIFLDEREPMLALLQEAVEARIRTKYARKIIRGYWESEKDKPSVLGALASPLSQREYDVLTLLEQRMSNDEIAGELVVSTSTVRTHLRSIFRKLEVHRRWDAVARARELDLL